MKNLSYVPGDAYAVVARDVTVLVGDLDHGLLTRLWHAVSAKADVMALLEVLGEGGFAVMPEFAAAVRTGADLRVVTRGSGEVSVVVDGDPTTCDATGVSTWSEQRFPADRVDGLTVTLGTPADSAALPVVAGVVRASVVTTGERAPAPTAAPASASASSGEADLEPVPRDEPTPIGQPTSIAEPPATQEPVDPPESVEPVDPAAPVDPALTMAEPDEASFDALFGATVAGRRPEDAAIREPEEFAEPADAEPAPVVAPPPSPSVAPESADAAPVDPDDATHPEDAVEAVDPEGDHDQHTMTPEEFARLRARLHGSDAVAPPPAPAASPASAASSVSPAPAAEPAGPRVVLTLSTGREIVMDRPVLVGRSPQARNTSSTQLPLLVVVDDPYVSGTHLELALVDGQLRATDTSSNGTLLRLGGAGVPAPMTRSESAVVSDGSVLVISDDISITVSVGGTTP